MCSTLMTAYLLVMSSNSGIVCIPMQNMDFCLAAISDFSQNFVETRRNKSKARRSELQGPGYTVITPKKNQRAEKEQKPEYALTCVRGKNPS